jgi:hypothetical protein
MRSNQITSTNTSYPSAVNNKFITTGNGLNATVVYE